ncbi:hypothetical protein LTR10_008383 [Elasticomyces elasticus]|nr:hypothetical protein LTR10_008383 [Elasticomyces elasticus]KAK4967257.1 hypothetical protein LTR42_010606 [Elasticomyces elasticus]
MCQTLITTAALALLTSSTTAMAIAKPIVPFTQTCQAYLPWVDGKNVNLKYAVHIGVKYADGQGCPVIQDALATKMGGSFNGFSCKDDGYGDTMLTFSSGVEHGHDLDSVFAMMYPEIAGGFDCGGDAHPFEKRSNVTVSHKEACPLPPPASNTATCKTEALHNAEWNRYTLAIGVEYKGGFGCNAIEASLRNKVGSSMSSYFCNNDGWGNTELVIYTTDHGHAGQVDVVLGEAYPMVTGDFTCTDTT